MSDMKINAGTHGTTKHARIDVKVGSIIDGIRVTEIRKGAPIGVFLETIFEGVTTCTPVRYKQGAWLLDIPFSELEVDLTSESNAIFFQMMNMLKRVQTPAPKGLGPINIAELAGDEPKIRSLFEENFFQFFSLAHPDRKKSYVFQYTEKNLAELKKRCEQNPKIKNRLLNLAVKSFKKIIIQARRFRPSFQQDQIDHIVSDNAGKYMDRIKPLLIQLGFEDVPLMKSKPSRDRRKTKGKLQEFREAAANGAGKAETTEGKKAETAKRMRRARTDVTTVKTEAPRARDAKPVEVEVPKIDVKRLPKVRG